MRFWERIADADRQVLSLRFGEPCDPRRLIDHHDVSVFLESFADYAAFFHRNIDDAAAWLAKLDCWSGITVQLEPGTSMVMLNPCQSPRRRTFTLAHEFGHIVRGHEPLGFDRLNGVLVRPCYSDEQEDEAHCYALALLIPYAPLLQFMDSGASDEAIARHYGVSVEALHMRYKRAGLWTLRT
jgi:hypothetical protein